MCLCLLFTFVCIHFSTQAWGVGITMAVVDSMLLSLCVDTIIVSNYPSLLFLQNWVFIPESDVSVLYDCVHIVSVTSLKCCWAKSINSSLFKVIINFSWFLANGGNNPVPVCYCVMINVSHALLSLFIEVVRSPEVFFLGFIRKLWPVFSFDVTQWNINIHRVIQNLKVFLNIKYGDPDPQTTIVSSPINLPLLKKTFQELWNSFN